MDTLIKTLSSILSTYSTNIIVGENIDWSNMYVLGYNPGYLSWKFVLENGLHQHVIVSTGDTSILDLVQTNR